MTSDFNGTGSSYGVVSNDHEVEEVVAEGVQEALDEAFGEHVETGERIPEPVEMGTTVHVEFDRPEEVVDG